MPTLTLPVVRHASSASFVRQVIMSLPARPQAVVVRRGHSFKLLDVRDLMIAFAQEPLNPVGKLALRDCIATLSRKSISRELLDRKVGSFDWPEWHLRERRRLLLLVHISDGIAHFEAPFDATYMGLPENPPDCICPNRHEYFHADGIPNDRLCVQCRAPLSCIG